MSRASQAGCFRITLSIDKVTAALGPTWMDLEVLPVAVEFGFLQQDAYDNQVNWVRMITGTADRICADQVAGEASLDGRDNAARLLDMPLQDSYLNSTSSELVVKLATSCGLEADVDETTNLVGQYYQIQHSKSALSSFSRHGNGWDLLSELAELEGYDLWVDDMTVHFKQPNNENNDLFDVTYSPEDEDLGSPRLTISSMQMTREFGLSGPLQVTVASWNSRQRRQVDSSYPAEVDDNARRFLVLKPNMLPDDAAVLAQNTYFQLRAHQRLIRGTMAGELDLTIRNQLRLSGTDTGWDCVYTIDRIEREMSLEGGFIQHVTARLSANQDTLDA